MKSQIQEQNLKKAFLFAVKDRQNLATEANLKPCVDFKGTGFHLSHLILSQKYL